MTDRLHIPWFSERYLSCSARIAVIVLLGVVASVAQAAELAYTCEVEHVYALNAQGDLEPSGFEKQFVGRAFSVSRVTGEIIGEVIPTLAAKSIGVVNTGSKENSFKAIAEFEGQIQLLEIQEFRESELKPFVASSMGGAGIVTGTCK